MTEATVEVISLEDIDLDKVPPCESKLALELNDDYRLCEKPSVARVSINCCRPLNLFMCEDCLNALKSGGMHCVICFSVIKKWREM